MMTLLGCLVAACASMGRPEGGPRDYNPPVFIKSTPVPGELNVTPTKIELTFDENVELDDAFNKVIISPVMKTTPVVRAQGKRVTVDLRDTLLPNTTYTLDFADAIKDLNEGNIIDGFAIDFSTGGELDTLRISGMVFEGRTLEPAQGMTVAVTDNLSDTALTKVPFQRIARTNQLGQFTVRNLKPGRYRVYAINDVNRDNLWDRSEDVAFYDLVVEPSASRQMVTDTIIRPDGTDSTFMRETTVYSQSDILLTWFNEDYKPQYVKDYKRPDRRRLDLVMGARGDSLPVINLIKDTKSLPAGQWALISSNSRCDSVTMWINDRQVYETDSLKVSVEYMLPDSVGVPRLHTDTLLMAWREPKKKVDKDPVKQAKADSIAAAEAMIFNIVARSATSHELKQPLVLEIPRPILSVDTTMLHLEELVDTVWTPLSLPPVSPGMPKPLTTRNIYRDWAPGAKYRLMIDSAAISDIYGAVNKPFKHEFTVKKIEDYANLRFTLSPVRPDTMPMILELLNGSDQPVRTARADASGIATLKLVTPGTYYARVFIDANNNGEWDTGSIDLKLQPEEVAYYNKKIDLRANWDNELTWNIYTIPLDQQKPGAIKKNKPKLKKGQKDPDTTDEDEELDEWGEPINGTNRGNGSKNKFSFGGGKQQSTGNSATIRDDRRR